MLLLQYLLKLSVSLAVIYLFYYFLLRRLTFYYHNRWYLAGYSLLCFFIALININPLLEKNQWLDNRIVKAFPTVHDLDEGQQGMNIVNNSGWSVWQWMILVFFTGFIILAIRLLIQYISFRRIQNNAELLADGSTRIYQVNKTIIPFSFGNSIFINQSQHEETELKEIIRHEFVHVKQKHTIDIVWSEILCALNWYNPFAWLIRKAIRQNLEFIADNNVLQSGLDRKQYQYLLLKVIGISHFSIASQFNFSSLKKRIAMMNKIRSAKVHLLKSLFVLPVVAMLLLAFRSQVNHSANRQTRNITDSLPRFDVSLHRSDRMDASHKAFFNRNPDIQLLHWKRNGSLTIYLTNNRVERYPADEMKKAESKYGPLPLPTIAEGSHASAILIKDTVPDQTIPNEKGYLIDIKDRSGHCTVVIRDKDKKIVKEIDYLVWNGEREKYEEQYGEIPAAPVVAAIAPLTTVSTLSSEQVLPIEVTVPVTAIATTVQSTVLTKIQTPGIPLNSEVPSAPLVATTIPAQVADVAVSRLPVTVLARTGVALEAIPTIEATPAGEKIMELKIYRSTKEADLKKMITDAKSYGVELDFDVIDYNDKGQLTGITGNMKKGDVSGNFNARDFAVVRLLLYKDGDVYKFKIVVSDKGELS